MIKNSATFLTGDNLRTLLHQLGQILDVRLAHYRRGTIYESVRPSDVRVFVAAARHQQTISEIARYLGISRQAAQSSVRRLQKIQVLDLQSSLKNKRDKTVIVTNKGELARKTAVLQIRRFECEFADIIGTDRLEQFRSDLIAVIEVTRLRNIAEN